MTRILTQKTVQAIRQIAIAIGLALLVVAGSANAANQTNRTAKYEIDVTIDASGDATFKETMLLPTQTYISLKEKVNNPIKLFRSVQNGLSWYEIEDLNANFDDANFSVKATYVNRGYLRVNRAGQWTLKFPTDSDPDLVSTENNTAIFVQAISNDLGTMTQTLRLRLPEGSTNIEHDKSQNELTFDFEPTSDASGDADVDFSLDSKPHLMSCLATLYGDEKFSNFWAARSVFKNESQQALKDYRVRFRVAGHSGWSPWNRTKVVYPGQSVVDPFFPVFDLNTLSEMSTARPAMVEVEYEYETADGKKVQEADASRVQLMARNQVVYSSREQSEVIDWSEAFEYGPFIIAAFTHSEDPAIQQLAGRVSGMANGAAASYTDADAEAFLTAMWQFMEMNKISYQSPPGLTVNNTFGQNVKYGRDVLRNRAGTCIDLAILWASAAKAVGLKSYVMLIPGHAFPVIGLPGGNVMPIEATAIGRSTFAQAVERGIEEYNSGLEGNHYLIDVDQLQDNGVRSLDLPSVDDNFLGQLGYNFETAAVNNNPIEQTQTNLQETNYQEQQTNTFNIQDLVGTWGVRYEDQGRVKYMQFTFTANSEYIFGHFESQNGQWVKFDEGKGTWGLQGTNLIINNGSTGKQMNFPCRFERGYLVLNSEGDDVYLEKTN